MGRPVGSGLKDVCIRGHSIALYGRDAYWRCRECNRENCKRTYNRMHRGNGPFVLSPAPIRRLVTRAQAAAFWAEYRCVNFDSAERAVARLWASRAISIDQADRWCIAIGSHLSVLYPALYRSEVSA